MIEHVGLIVPSRREAGAYDLVESIDAQTRQPDIFVFANNDETDPNLDITPSLGEGMENFHVIHVPERGAGHARHAAVEEVLRLAEVQGIEVDAILSTDADCKPSSNWIEMGVDYLDEHPEAQVGYATTTVREDDEFFRPEYHEQWPAFWANLRQEIADMTDDDSWLHVPPGANMIFRAGLYRPSAEGPAITFPQTAFDIEGGQDEDIEFGQQVYQRWGASALQVIKGWKNPTSMRRLHATGGPVGLRAHYLGSRAERAVLGEIRSQRNQ